jgi:hypothetical protein
MSLPSAGEAANVYDVKFRVTPGAGIQAFEKTKHFYPFTEYQLTKGASEGGYDVYTGKLPANFHYEAGGGETGFLKQAQVIYLKNVPEEQVFEIDLEQLDASHRVDNGYKQDSVYFNVNNAQHLVMPNGSTFKLLPIRVWQAEEGATGNYFIEPDYNVEVLGDASAVSLEWKGSPGSKYIELRGLSDGVAVLRITYDPIKLYHQNGDDYTYFNATNPIDTGIVVVSVAADVSGINGVKTNIEAREYDTVYFDKGKTNHASYSFKPDGSGLSVRVHRPIHAGGATWGEGWSNGLESSDGRFSVDLYEGRNIVEVSAGANKAYHVINAKGVAIGVKNLSDSAWKSGDALKAGDELEISFDGIKTPLEKISGIYNPGFPDTCYVSYETADGGEARSEGVQYNLSGNNAIKVTVPQSGRVSLTNGVINCDHMGDPLDSHRNPDKVLGAGIDPNFSSVNVKGVYCKLPDITLGNSNNGGSGDGGDSGGGCDVGAWGGFGLAALLIGSRALTARRRV